MIYSTSRRRSQHFVKKRVQERGCDDPDLVVLGVPALAVGVSLLPLVVLGHCVK